MSLVRASAVMTVGTILSRATGLLRLTAITAALGVAESRLADSYNLANMVPNLLYSLLLGGILTSVFVPVIVEMLDKEGRDRAWEGISALINLSVLVLCVATMIGMVAAPWIAEFYATRLEGDAARAQQHVITVLLQLFIPQVIFYGLTALTAGLLNANGRFGAPMYTPVLNNILVVAIFAAFHTTYGNVGLDATPGQLLVIGAGTTLGVAAMALAQLPFLRGLGRYRFNLSIRHPAIKKVAKLSVWVVGYMTVTQLGFLAVQWLSNAQQGGYSAYFVGFTFYMLPISMFGLSITTALLPQMSRQASNESWANFRERMSLGIRATTFLIVPASVGYFVLAQPLVELLLENGVMTPESTSLVVDVLRFFVVGLPQGAIVTFFVRSFYSMQDARTPFFLASLVVIFNTGINVPLFAWLGVEGLALGHALASTFGILLLGRSLARRAGGLDGTRVRKSVTRITLASIVMGVIVWLLLLALNLVIASEGFLQQCVLVGVPSVGGIVSYVLLAHAFKVEEIAYVRRLLTRSRTPEVPTSPTL
ncbi:MAG: murein biosynthesis integral membrane protein MurJ [Actinomycetota bacterium]